MPPPGLDSRRGWRRAVFAACFVCAATFFSRLNYTPKVQFYPLLMPRSREEFILTVCFLPPSWCLSLSFLRSSLEVLLGGWIRALTSTFFLFHLSDGQTHFKNFTWWRNNIRWNKIHLWNPWVMKEPSAALRVQVLLCNFCEGGETWKRTCYASC